MRKLSQHFTYFVYQAVLDYLIQQDGQLIVAELLIYKNSVQNIQSKIIVTILSYPDRSARIQPLFSALVLEKLLSASQQRRITSPIFRIPAILVVFNVMQTLLVVASFYTVSCVSRQIIPRCLLKGYHCIRSTQLLRAHLREIMEMVVKSFRLVSPFKVLKREGGCGFN